MGALMEQTLTIRSLTRAWEDVFANDRQDGISSRSVERFAEHAQSELEQLSKELSSGCYVPRDLAEVSIQDGGASRTLHIPTVRDRVVERSLLEVINPWVDPVLGFSSFAYRTGLGVSDAVQALVGFREEGLRWVLRTDINDCFPSVPVGYARRLLSALVDDTELLLS